MAYTYDPSQNIQQGFQQAASGVGNIFTQVIAQQQRDYNLAENAFQNIEALKKNLNIFGQKSITSKANDLLGKTSSAIMKNGKLDYSALGDIRQQVSEIGDLKQGYDVGAKEYERMLQLGVANKDNLVSFEKFYKDLSAKMGDENLVKNPQDLQKALADTYTNNLDSFKMFGKSYLSSNPYKKTARDIVDPKTGALMRVQAELPAGWSFGAQGNIIPPEPKTMIVNGQQVTMDYADQELARIQATSPEQLVLMRKQAGFEGQNLSDKEIVKASIDKIPMTVQSTQVKSKAETETEQYKAESARFATENQGLILKSDLNAKAASAASSWASANYYNKKADQEEVDMMYDPYKDFTKVSFKGSSTGNQVNLTKYPIGKDISLNINGQQGIIKSVARDENGGVWVEAWHNRGNKISAKMDKSERGAGFKWKKVSNFDEFNTELSQEINVGSGIPSKQKAMVRKAIGTLYSLPTNSNPTEKPTMPKPTPASGRVAKNTYSKYTDSELLSDPGRNTGIYAKMSDATYLAFLKSQ